MVKAMLLSGSRHRGWADWAVTYLHVFRGVVVGSCLVVVVLAWFTHIHWLLLASGCIGTGEFVESTYYLVVLRWAKRSGRVSFGGRPFLRVQAPSD